MKNKVKIGIDINEVLRARWIQFDRFYVEEFGDELSEEEAKYVYDLFNEYKWEDKEEEIKMLNEDLPDDINPLDYQVDENGESPVDSLAFKTEKHKLTAREHYNRFMYEDYLFEIHGSAPVMYKNMEVDVEKFIKKYEDYADFIILSQENWFSIPPTLFFLSRIMCRFKNYKFVEEKQEMWDDIDILITTDPEILNAGVPDEKIDVKSGNQINKLSLPSTKKIIKLHRPYNEDCQDGVINKKLFHLNDLNGNVEFEEIIGFPQDKDDSNVEQKNEENE